MSLVRYLIIASMLIGLGLAATCLFAASIGPHNHQTHYSGRPSVARQY
jgi:hypothetical protein